MDVTLRQWYWDILAYNESATFYVSATVDTRGYPWLSLAVGVGAISIDSEGKYHGVAVNVIWAVVELNRKTRAACPTSMRTCYAFLINTKQRTIAASVDGDDANGRNMTSLTAYWTTGTP
jgi:hypothetical protein